jgi:glutathione S-transferase
MDGLGQLRNVDFTARRGQLDAHLATVGPCVAGADFTLADIPIGLVVNRRFALKFDCKPDYANGARYYEQLSTRPAYMRHGRNGLP